MDQTQQQLVYESPDGGRTVFARRIGQSDRTLVKSDPLYQEIADQYHLQQVWEKILKASKKDPILKNMLEQVEIYYRLKRED